jgi:hypothetical protein
MFFNEVFKSLGFTYFKVMAQIFQKIAQCLKNYKYSLVSPTKWTTLESRPLKRWVHKPSYPRKVAQART